MKFTTFEAAMKAAMDPPKMAIVLSAITGTERIAMLLDAGIISKDEAQRRLDNIQGKEKPMSTESLDTEGDQRDREMSEYLSDPYNHHDWAKYLPRAEVIGRTGDQDMRAGDVWAGRLAAGFKCPGYVIQVLSCKDKVASVQALAGTMKSSGQTSTSSLYAQHAHLIARVENGVLHMMPGVGIDKPVDTECEIGVDRCGWHTTDGMQCAGFHGHGYLHNTDPAWWVKRGLGTPMVHFVADPNLRPAPKPNFHGVKVGEYRNLSGHYLNQGDLAVGRVIKTEDHIGRCVLEFKDGRRAAFSLRDIAGMPLEPGYETPAVPRCKTGTACKSPTDAPLGYLGLCFPCTAEREIKAGTVPPPEHWPQPEPLRMTAYDNSRSAGIGIAGTIWKTRG